MPKVELYDKNFKKLRAIKTLYEMYDISEDRMTNEILNMFFKEMTETENWVTNYFGNLNKQPPRPTNEEQVEELKHVEAET